MRKNIFLTLAVLFLFTFSVFGAESVLINYSDDAQVEIINNDLRILIDVGAPAKVTSTKNYKEEILLTTHHHSDHYNADFMKNFKGKQIDFKAGELKGNNYSIRSIPSYHDEYDKVRFGDPTNYTFIIETGGLRIAHFGAVGVPAFTDEELKQFGQIDIAFMQVYNTSSSMDMKNEKAFKLMAQVKPKIIIPTHSNKDSVGKAAKDWNGKYFSGKFFEISKDKLPKTTTLVVLGELSKAYANIFKLEEFK
jgi:phosphoribosyl 1,2-cyclic phosphodiesterase